MARTSRTAHAAPTCDWTAQRPTAARGNRSKIYRHGDGFKWRGIKEERYKEEAESWSAITRHVLIGSHRESTKFEVRYFEIATGGRSSLERHRHEHVVICIRGRGQILIGRRLHALRHLDTAYLAPNEVHQLSNPHAEPFGFICIVSTKRDRPRLVKDRSPKS